MIYNSNRTCILYFSTGNSSSKSFSSKKRKTIAIQKILFNKTLLEIRKTKLPYLISDGLIKDASFSDKIAIAANEAFNRGFKKIILVGDDTPQLSTDQLLKAAQGLSKNELCVGPATDGGAYLISFTQQQFEEGILKDLAWQTAQLLESLLKNITNSKLAFKILDKFSDLDSESDIQQFLQNNSFLKFAKVLQTLCKDQKISTSFSFIIELGQTIAFHDRGPPLAA